MNNQEKNKGRNIFILILCIIVYIITTNLVTFSNRNENLDAAQAVSLNGIWAQIQVLATVVMVVTNKKRGFIVGCILNIFGMFSAIMGMIRSQSLNALPGVMIPIVTIGILSVIYGSQVKNQKNQDEIQKQNKELTESAHALHDKDQALRTLAYTDSLTGMYNKTYFREQIDEALKLNAPFTMVYMDIDDFKTINDNFGPKTGDATLIAYADRLKKFCGRKYPTARIGGDEFAILVTHSEQTEADILNIVDMLRHLFGEPINIQGTIISRTVSYGIVSAPRDGNETELLLDNAIMATYTAKANGKDRPCFFSQAT